MIRHKTGIMDTVFCEAEQHFLRSEQPHKTPAQRYALLAFMHDFSRKTQVSAGQTPLSLKQCFQIQKENSDI